MVAPTTLREQNFDGMQGAERVGFAHKNLDGILPALLQAG